MIIKTNDLDVGARSPANNNTKSFNFYTRDYPVQVFSFTKNNQMYFNDLQIVLKNKLNNDIETLKKLSILVDTSTLINKYGGNELSSKNDIKKSLPDMLFTPDEKKEVINFFAVENKSIKVNIDNLKQKSQEYFIQKNRAKILIRETLKKEGFTHNEQR